MKGRIKYISKNYYLRWNGRMMKLGRKISKKDISELKKRYDFSIDKEAKENIQKNLASKII